MYRVVLNGFETQQEAQEFARTMACSGYEIADIQWEEMLGYAYTPAKEVRTVGLESHLDMEVERVED
jgi:hypothetical protein